MANKNPSPSTRFKKGDTKLQSLGGQKAKAVNAFAKTFKEAAIKALDEVKYNKVGAQVVAREMIVGSLIKESLKGNVRAAELLMKVAGEAPVDKHEVTGADGQDLFANRSDAELKGMLNDLMQKLGKC